ncbi:ester cyclase [Paenibacillus rhizovicinus]|uniref:Ester cyclase n=1 Tax=Paenibacillus rhizovicinus TaxID=2704463 RepID=A0A6C0NXP8_9BACL|nr:ester cyclase [Paenibacillus rhizovicinus]QHW30968.1 ester cyclase [Paenibacillus rhizovicinus]
MKAAEIVEEFFARVRSGLDPDAAHSYMAGCVAAHQVTAENEQTVERSPQNYADHVRDMMKAYGAFQLQIKEFLASEDRVYVRWKQTGMHVGEVEGFAPTGKPIIEIASAVYRIANDKIVEYWIQIDREGIRKQLEHNAAEVSQD